MPGHAAPDPDREGPVPVLSASPPRRWRLLLILGVLCALGLALAWWAVGLPGCETEIARWAPCLDRGGPRVEPPGT